MLYFRKKKSFVANPDANLTVFKEDEMKRISCSIVIALILVFNTVGEVFAFVEDDFVFSDYLTDGQNSVTSVAAWGEYLFAAEDNGLGIYNINTKERMAKWNLKSNSVIPQVGNTFVPSAVEVTDNYIIVLSASNAIAVFPNEGRYTNTPPSLIRRLGLFNDKPRMTYQNGYLYILDKVGAATVRGNGTTTYSAESGSVVLWKIDINNIDLFPYAGSAALKYSALNVATMISEGYSKLINLGKYDYLWGETAVENGRLYAVTYNDTTTAPYKTLYLNNIELEPMIASQTVLCEKSPAGLSVSFFTETGNAGDIKALYVYDTDNEENKALISSFGRNVQVSSIKYNDGNYYTTVYFKDMAAFASAFSVTEAELSSGSRSFAIKYNEEEQILTYSENSESLNLGAVAVKNGYVYAMTGSGARGQTAVLAKMNYAYIVNANNADNMELINEFLISLVPDNGNGRSSAVQSAVTIGNYLVYFGKNVANNAMIINIENPEEVTGAIAETIHIPAVIGTSSVLNQAIVYAGNIYYPTSKNVAVIESSVFVDKINIPENITHFPTSVAGESSEGKSAGTVNISIDDISTEVNSACGAYILPVLALSNGIHSISVNANVKDVTVNVPEAVKISDFSFDSASNAVKFKAANNTNKHFFKSKNITFVAAVYDNDGKFSDSAEVSETIAYEGEKEITVSGLAAPNGGSIVIYALSGGKLLDSPYSSESGKAERTAAFKSEKDINAQTVVNAASKTVSVSGDYLSGAELYITLTRSGAAVDIAVINCATDGSFSYEYDYSDDVIMGSEDYTLKITSIQKETEDAVTLNDDTEFEARIAELKAAVHSGRELLEYLQNNEDMALALGINLSNTYFAALDSKRKETVMDKVYAEISSDNYRNASTVFVNKSKELLKAYTEEKALAEIKGAAAASLKGVLETYKDICGISDALWEKYEKTGKKITKVNSYFLKKNLTSLSDVPDYLKKSIDAVMNDDSTGGGGTTSEKPSNTGKVTVPDKEPIQITPVEPYKDKFSDVSDGHWAKECIEYLADKGILNGIGNRMFAPERELTREEAVKLLIEAYDKLDKDAVSQLSDVKAGEWYYPYVASAEKIGLVKGDGENFGIGNKITRQDFAVMVLRMAEISGTKLSDSSEEFTDINDVSDYAKDSVLKLKASGIMSGDESGAFNPQSFSTRAMAAKVLYNLITINGGAKNE